MKSHHTNRSRSYYRHHRKRAIARKVHILNQVFGISLKDLVNDVRCYPKNKVHCSCCMCKPEKFFKIEKEKYKFSKRDMQSEINEYYASSEGESEDLFW